MSDINEMNVGVRWYVVHTYSGYENKVMANIQKIVENRGLGDLIFEAKIPVETVLEKKEATHLSYLAISKIISLFLLS